jgi:hypothetical protein
VAKQVKVQLAADGKPTSEHVLVLRVQEERRHGPLLQKVFLHILISFYNFFLWTLKPFFNFILLLLLLFYLSLSGIFIFSFYTIHCAYLYLPAGHHWRTYGRRPVDADEGPMGPWHHGTLLGVPSRPLPWAGDCFRLLLPDQ